MNTNPIIKLRSFAKSDLATLRHWFTDDSISSRISAPDTRWLAHIQSAHVRALSITDQSGDLIGLIQIDTEEDGNHWCDMMIAPDRQGQGYGSAALNALGSLYAQKEKSLCATVEPDNTASIRCLTKCGFTKDSVSDADGFLIYRLRQATESKN